MRIGILTGGGDCPGLNAAIRAVVLTAELQHGDEVIGYLDGWKGVLDDQYVRLDVRRCRDILALGGTILGTSRTNPFKVEGGPERVRANVTAHGVDALVAVGGEDTLGVALRLGDHGVRAVGVPKTIDNDLSGTEVTFGFDTAVQIATEAIDRSADDGGVASPGHRVRGHGPPRGVDRHPRRDRRRRGRDPRARGPLRRRRRYATGCSVATWAGSSRRSSSSPRARSLPTAPTPSRRDSPRREHRSTNSATPAWGGSAPGWPRSSSAGRGSRPGPRPWATSSAGARPRPSTASSPRASVSPRWRAVHDGAFGTMVALQCGEIVRVPIADAVAKSKTVDLDLYRDVAGMFLG